MADLNEPKKETVRITLPPRTPSNPAESDKEATRINLPSRPPGGGTVSLHPPSAAPVRPPPLPVAPTPASPPGAPDDQAPASPLMARPPAALAPPGATPPSPPVAPATPQRPGIPSPAPDVADHGSAAGPRKETARVASTPDSPMKATVRLSNVQPSSAPPGGVMRAPPLPVASLPPAALVEPVPATFCWALLGVSALTLLIQLWTYFS